MDNDFDVNNISKMLLQRGEEQAVLLQQAADIKSRTVGNKVYFRGLIEYSNVCAKNCKYCGIRSGNHEVNRYTMTDDEVMEAVEYAWKNRFASIVIQSGEIQSDDFSARIERILEKVKIHTKGEIAVTLSCGEQTPAVYKRWFAAGAKRYLLRIETSNRELYSKLHPQDENHSFQKRLDCLASLKELDYQVGSGIMIGLPFQTTEDIARDLLFLRAIDIDMVGMGPYIEHEKTPLYEYREQLPSLDERFNLTLNSIAVLRLMMNTINIAATTAMQTLRPNGRERAISAGANVIMPNLTPVQYKADYLLYENKPCLDEEKEMCAGCLEERIKSTGNEVAYGEWGDSVHYHEKKQNVPH